MPTETVYGLAANALNTEAIARIYSIKKRPSYNPLIVHVSSINDFSKYAVIPQGSKVAERLEKLSTFWPGPLTVVLQSFGKICENVSAGTNTIALRIPNNPVALKLLQECNLPLAAPSANPSGYISPTSAEHVMQTLGDSFGIILDGGPCKLGIESTVLSLVEENPVILRPGIITKEQIEEALSEELATYVENTANKPTSPGMLQEHYAPHTPLAFIDETDLSKYAADKIGFLTFNDNSDFKQKFRKTIFLSTNGSMQEAAHKLYSALYELDRAGLDLIVVEKVGESDIGAAIMNRLKRAVSRTQSL